LKIGRCGRNAASVPRRSAVG